MTPRPPARPTREGVTVDPFGDVTVPDKPKSWSQRRYRETYDADPMTIWVAYLDGGRAVFTAGGPLSARALLRGLHLNVHLVRWGLPPEGASRMPAELLERAGLDR